MKTLDSSQKSIIQRYLDEFRETYLNTEDGKEHIAYYGTEAEEVKLVLDEIRSKKQQEEDITDDVLYRLLPHVNTKHNRQAGYRISTWPAITKDVKAWFEGIGWQQPDNWPQVAQEIFTLLVEAQTDPDNLGNHIKQFTESGYNKGFQAGFLSPLLYCINPSWPVINSKIVRTFNFIMKAVEVPEKIDASLDAYTQHAEAVTWLIKELGIPWTEFDAFCHWMCTKRLGGYVVGGKKVTRPQVPEGISEDVAELIVAWKSIHCPEERILFRERKEQQALQLLQAQRGILDAPSFKKVLELVNQDWYGGKQTNKRFGSAFWGSNLELLLKNLETLNQWLVRIIDVPEDEGQRVLGEFWDEQDIPGAGTGLPTVIAYLRNPQRFNIWLPATSKGLQRLTGIPFSRERTVENYNRFNDSVTQLREEHDLPPQCMDIILSLAAKELREPVSAPPRTSQAWWIVASDKHWDWEAFLQRGLETFTGGLLRQNFELARPEQLGVLYRSSPHREVSAIIQISRSGYKTDDGAPCVDIKPVVELKRPISWKELQKNPVLQESEPVLHNTQGTMFGMTSEEFQELVRLVVRDNPDTRPFLEDVLEPPTKETKFYFPEDELQKIVRLLAERKQIIITGPPGTGKTLIARKAARGFAEADDRVIFVQFHPSYSYEDFVEGIRPEPQSGGMTFSVVPGIFRRFCERAANDPNNNYVLIIDEINRGDLSKIFGELLYGLEYRGPAHPIQLAYSPDAHFYVPKNAYLVGTMNSVDRSIALVDYAIRRRFIFYELEPSYDILEEYYQDEDNGVSEEMMNVALELFRSLNVRITERLDRDHRVGHSYFMVERLDQRKLNEIWTYGIRPLLAEYFFHRQEDIREYDELFLNLRSETGDDNSAE